MYLPAYSSRCRRIGLAAGMNGLAVGMNGLAVGMIGLAADVIGLAAGVNGLAAGFLCFAERSFQCLIPFNEKSSIFFVGNAPRV